MGAGKFVAVNSSVGNGVSVTGMDVKVGTVAVMVGNSNGATVPPMGWKGVGVAEAFGFGVISSTGERGGAKGAIPQAERMKSKRTWMVRRGFTRFILIGLPISLSKESIVTQIRGSPP